jgi:cation diffusion facilitator family transporter
LVVEGDTSPTSLVVEVGGGEDTGGLSAAFFSALPLVHKDAAALAALPRAVRPYYAAQSELVDFYCASLGALAEERRAGVVPGSVPPPSPGRGATDAAGGGAAALSPAAAAAAAPQPAADAASLTAAAVGFAINASMCVNVLLLIIKVYAAATSSSIAVVASTIDSFLDLLSGSIMWASSTLAARRDNAHAFPVGKTRYEPVAILIFSCIMGSAALQILTESAQKLVAGFTAGSLDTGVTPATVGIIAATVALKAGLWALCGRLAAASASCDALATDHMCDVATNAVTLAALLVVERAPVAWPADPAAAIVLALWMLFVWTRQGKQQVLNLSSKAASAQQLSKLVFVALTHAPAHVQFVDTVMAYYVGNKMQVECDIGLAADMHLKDAHDIGENLQRRLEAVEDVERAFVHLDTEFNHSKDVRRRRASTPPLHTHIHGAHPPPKPPAVRACEPVDQDVGWLGVPLMWSFFLLLCALEGGLIIFSFLLFVRGVVKKRREQLAVHGDALLKSGHR